jgi:hypothetical protein
VACAPRLIAIVIPADRPSEQNPRRAGNTCFPHPRVGFPDKPGVNQIQPANAKGFSHASETRLSRLQRRRGIDNIERASSYMEDALRMTVHLIMSTPEYQIV